MYSSISICWKTEWQDEARLSDSVVLYQGFERSDTYRACPCWDSEPAVADEATELMTP